MRLDQDVIGVLARSTVTGDRLALPPVQLPRPLYVKVDKALQAMGGKWNRSARVHIFAEDIDGILADALGSGVVVDRKKEFQFFETPPEIARRLVEMADVRRYHRILEPSAGSGRIIQALREAGVTHAIVAFELDEWHHPDLERLGAVVGGCDFFALRASDFVPFDRIIANPPFSRGQDIAHVSKMWEVLKPGGRLVSITSPAWTFREAGRWSQFRDFVQENDGEWYPLPEGCFASSGTNVNAGILVLDKAVTS